MKADDIDAAMLEIGDRLNRVGVGADAATMSKLNALLADWQDFYWSEYQQWPVNQLAVWADNLPNMRDAITRLEREAGSQGAPVTSAPKPGGMTTLDPLKVTGTWPLWMKVSALGVLGLALYKVASKTRLL
jgi:hypothetical protein